MKVLCVFIQPDLVEAKLLCKLQSSGFEVQVFCESKAAYQELLNEAEIPIRHIALKSKLSLSAITAIRKVILTDKPDIVHAFSARALSNVLLATTGLKLRPKILAYRGVVGNVSRVDPTSWISYLNPKVDAVSCVSEAVNKYLASVGVPKEKLHTIYKGHDVSWYQNESKEYSRGSLGITAETIVIGCVANMRPSKGIDVLFEAIEKLPQDLPVKFLLVGQMELPGNLKDDPRIIALGFKKQASALMNLFDIIVMPSRTEGLPKALLEAMAQGVAPIVTYAGGIPEIVRDGVDGIIVPVGDSEKLAEEIKKLVSDPASISRFKVTAKERVMQKFSIEQTVEQTAALYRRSNGVSPL
jgi:glycosyltransferase involved in cell wall biosynthesis